MVVPILPYGSLLPDPIFTIKHHKHPFPLLLSTERRLREIIDWGLQNSRQHAPSKGLLQSVAEDWPLVPGPIRRGIRKSHKNFEEIRDRYVYERLGP